MKKDKMLLNYLYFHRYVIAGVGGGFFLFWAVFSLYSLPMEAIFYACALTATFFLIIGGFRYAAFCRRHNALQLLRQHVTQDLPAFPPAQSVLELDYQELVLLLGENRRALLSDMDRIHTDAADYYSLWVHQIKTPIAAMGLLLQSMEQGETRRQLADQLFRTEQYVDMVLGYLRIDSPSTDLIIANCPLEGAVKQAVRKYSSQFIRTKTRLDIEEPLGSAVTDEKWLCFAIEQLLSNALKYAGGTQVFIYMENPQTLVVADKGIGIDAADLPRIFEKGYTGYNGRIGQKSSGIGLYLAKKVLDRLRHTIRVESEPGKGTKVKIGFHVTEL